MVDLSAGLVQVRSVHSKTVLWKGVSEDTLVAKGNPTFSFYRTFSSVRSVDPRGESLVREKVAQGSHRRLCPRQSPDELFLVSHIFCMLVMCSAFDRLDDFKYQKCVPWPLLQDFPSKRMLYSYFLFLLIQSLPPTPAKSHPHCPFPLCRTALQLFTPQPSPPSSDLQRKSVQNPETK